MTGVASSLTIVPVALLRANEAFETPKRMTVMVSFGSGSVSPITFTVRALVVSPGLKVTVGQQTNWKSLNDALPVNVSHSKEMWTTAGGESVTVKFIGVVPLFPSVACASAMLMSGAGSSSKIVKVRLDGVPIVAPPVALEILNENV